MSPRAASGRGRGSTDPRLRTLRAGVRIPVRTGAESNMIGLKEQTVHGAKTIAEAHARHRWQIPPDYNVAIDCLERPFHRIDSDEPACGDRRVRTRLEFVSLGFELRIIQRHRVQAIVTLAFKMSKVQRLPVG